MGPGSGPGAGVSFASPLYLAALALVPILLLFYVTGRRRARRYAVRFPGVSTLAPLVPTVAAWRRRVPLVLFLAALAALALALARPHATVAVPSEQASVVLVTDVSRSMLADDVDPSRLEAARTAATRFLEELPDAARVGAVAFSEQPHTIEPPTDDHDEVAAVIDSLSADGGTATGDGLAAALDLVDGQGEKRAPAAIVLLSDGKATTGRDPLGVARQARRLQHPHQHGGARQPGSGDHHAERRPAGSAPRSRDDAPHRRALRRPQLRGLRRRRPGRDLRAARLPRGNQEGTP